ncbi:hypothetical protein OA88_14090 [Flavobacterium sp. JRM]|nr:hypothetical protein OA88_14090 [Flavobacterium sp. JRM]
MHSFWSVFGTLLSRGSMLVSAIILARILNQVEYGQLGILRSTLNFFVVFAGFGLGNTTSKYIALNKKDNISEARRIFDISLIFNFILAIIIALMVFVFAKQITIWSFNDVTLYKQLRVSSFLLFFATMNGVFTGSLAGFQDFKTIAKNAFYSTCVQSVLSLIGAYYFGVTGSLIGFGLGYVYLYILNKRAIDKCFGLQKRMVSFQNYFSEKKSFLWSFSLPAAFSSFLVTPVFWWAKSFMIRSTSFKEMAFFDVADQWRLVILFVPSALMQIVLPALTMSNKEDFKKTLQFNIKINLFFTLISIVPLILISKYILSLYGKDYVNTELFIVLISSALFSSFCSVIGLAIASKGKMWHGFMFNLFWAVYFIFFTIYFINNGYGATGLAYAITLSYLLHGTIQFIYFKIKLKREE